VIIAEISGNHDGSLAKALDIVRAVADAGAQMVKLQTYTADTITIDADTPPFRISDGHELWGGVASMTFMRRRQHRGSGTSRSSRSLEISGSCRFEPIRPDGDRASGKLDAPVYKVASSELTDLPLVTLMAETGSR